MLDLDFLPDILRQNFSLQATWVRYVVAFFIILACLVLKKIFDIYLSQALLRLTQKTKFRYDEQIIKAMNAPVSAAFLVIGFFLAINSLDLPTEPLEFRRLTLEAFRISTAVIIVWAAFRLTDIFSLFLGDYFSDKDEVIRLQFIPLINKALRLFVVVVGGLLIVQNLGYSVGSLLAGLGIGGLAVALAAQESLSNFFGSIVLLTDRPFKIGDWITIDGADGTVEELGFRSTRVRTFSKSLVTIPNKTLANSIVENWSAMPVRRVSQVIGLTYDTPVDKMEEYLAGLRKALEEHPGVDQTFKMVQFTDFGASSLDIMLYYFTKSKVWGEHLAVKQDINLACMRLAESLGLSFAFPSRSLYWGPGEKPGAQKEE